MEQLAVARNSYLLLSVEFPVYGAAALPTKGHILAGVVNEDRSLFIGGFLENFKAHVRPDFSRKIWQKAVSSGITDFHTTINAKKETAFALTECSQSGVEFEGHFSRCAPGCTMIAEREYADCVRDLLSGRR